MKKISLLVGLMLFTVSMYVQGTQPQVVIWNTTANPFFMKDGNVVAMQGGRMLWVDINNDGYKDVFAVAGADNMTAQNGSVFLYKNNRDMTFTSLTDEIAEITPMTHTSAEFIDFDNDGDLDLITIGIAAGGRRITSLYENNNGTFTKVDSPFPDLSPEVNGANGRQIVAVDYDHDGWTDLLITGTYETPINDKYSFTRLYRNIGGSGILGFEMQTNVVTSGGDGNGNFVERSRGCVNVGDVNGDGYADIIVTGINDRMEAGARTQANSAGGELYINNGDGTFTQWIPSESPWFTAAGSYEVALIDLNGDGYSDILEFSPFNSGSCFVYMNQGNAENISFTRRQVSEILPMNGASGDPSNTSIAAGDINNDGLVDVFVQAMTSNQAGGRILYNNGDGTFTVDNNLSSGARARSGTANLLDIDGDGNLDYSACGFADGSNKSGYAINTLFDLISGSPIPSNAAPTAPTNFNVTYDAGKFLLTWSGATDDHTPVAALLYNVYAKNKETGMVYMYAPVDITTGKLKMAGTNIPLIASTSFKWNLPDGNYTFGVSTVDQAGIASVFATFEYIGTDIKSLNKVGMRVSSKDKTIVIENPLPVAAFYTVINIGGQIVASGVCPAGEKQSVLVVAQGVYIVKTAGNVVKLLVF